LHYFAGSKAVISVITMLAILQHFPEKKQEERLHPSVQGGKAQTSHREARPAGVNNPPRARDSIFHGRFYGLRNFGCRTSQFCATRRESKVAKCRASATMRKPVKTRAKTLS
jgi:hypothetical protein